MQNKKILIFWKKLFQIDHFWLLLQGIIKRGTASGKTTFTKTLSKDSKIKDKITVLGMDNFYKGCPENFDASEYDFDHP